MEEMKYAFKILCTKTEGKRPLGRLMHRKQDNIKMDLKEKECEDVHWIHVTQDRIQWQGLVNMVVNLQVP
jgi:hypothetical protein